MKESYILQLLAQMKIKVVQYDSPQEEPLYL